MRRPTSLNSALKAAKPELKNYVLALESENAKLQRQIAKLEVTNLSKQNRIISLGKENKKLSKANENGIGKYVIEHTYSEKPT